MKSIFNFITYIIDLFESELFESFLIGSAWLGERCYFFMGM